MKSFLTKESIPVRAFGNTVMALEYQIDELYDSFLIGSGSFEPSIKLSKKCSK